MTATLSGHEFQRLNGDKSRRLSLDWNFKRTLSKLDYCIHTDAIKAHLIPVAVTPERKRLTYASEADVLNLALFGQNLPYPPALSASYKCA